MKFDVGGSGKNDGVRHGGLRGIFARPLNRASAEESVNSKAFAGGAYGTELSGRPGARRAANRARSGASRSPGNGTATVRRSAFRALR